MTGIVPSSASATSTARSTRPSSCLGEARCGEVDLRADRRAGADERGDLGHGHEHVAHRGARLERGRERDHGDLRLAGSGAECSARRRHDPPRANGGGGLEAGERLLGVARVAGAEDDSVGRRPRGQLVVADRRQRQVQPVAQGGPREVAADARAAHPANDEAGPRKLADPSRLDPEERVRQVVGEGEDVVELVLRIDLADRVQSALAGPGAHDATPPGSRRASCSTTVRGSIRAPSPITEPCPISAPAPTSTPAPRIESSITASWPTVHRE